MTTDIRKAQAQLDRCRALGHAVWFWQGKIHITGKKPSAQRLAQLRKHEGAFRVILGDDGRTTSWAVRQLGGGALLYQHPRFSREPTPAREVITMSFGKYRGAPVDVVVDDVSYAEWLLQQEWFFAKYPAHHRVLTDALARNPERCRAECSVSGQTTFKSSIRAGDEESFV